MFMGYFLVFAVFVAPIILLFAVTAGIEFGVGTGGGLFIVIGIPVILILVVTMLINNPSKSKLKGYDPHKPPVSVRTKEYERQRLEYNKKQFPEYYKD